MRLTPGTVADEIAGADGVCIVANGRLCFTFEDIDTFLFEEMNVNLGGFATGLDFDDVEAQALQAGQVSERLVATFRVVIQEMRLFDSLEFLRA